MKLRTLASVIFVIGLALTVIAIIMPVYNDQKSADDLFNSLQFYPGDKELDKGSENSTSISKDDFYRREAELRTNRGKIMDFAGGITVASATFLFFLIGLKIKESSDLKDVLTMNKPMLFVTSNLVWLLMIPGTHWYYIFRGARGDYPPFADSISIPLSTEIPAYYLAMIPLNMFLILTTVTAKLPTSLFVFCERNDTRLVLVELFFGLCLFINFLTLLSVIYDGDHFTILVTMFFAYILLTLRAGHICKWIN
jgi:hypothetical protein